MKCEDNEKKELNTFVCIWFVYWSANIYGSLLVDDKHISEFGKFINLYVNTNTRAQALEEFKQSIDLFKNTRDVNIEWIRHKKWAVGVDEALIDSGQLPKFDENTVLSTTSSISKVQCNIYSQYTETKKDVVTTLDFSKLIDGVDSIWIGEMDRFMNQKLTNGIGILIDAILYAMEIRPMRSFSRHLLHCLIYGTNIDSILISRFDTLSTRVKSEIFSIGLTRNPGGITSQKCVPFSSCLRIIYELQNNIIRNNSPNMDTMQACAFYGYYREFQYCSRYCTYSLQNITGYAVAGGNREIISKLKKANCNFDNTFFIAVIYHRNDILDFLLEIGRQKAIDEDICRSVYNLEAYNFITINRERFIK